MNVLNLPQGISQLLGRIFKKGAAPFAEIFPDSSNSVVSPYGGPTPPISEVRHLPDSVLDRVIECPPELSPNAVSLSKYRLIVSIDTEYVQNRVAKNSEGKPVLGNTILSYQYSAVFIDSNGKSLYAEGIVKTIAGKRISYRKLLGIIFGRFGVSYKRAKKITVLSIAHFGLAEWAAYEDRQKLLPFLTPVRKVPARVFTETIGVSSRAST